MKRIFESILKTQVFSEESTAKIATEMLTKVYGSYENGVAQLVRLKQNSKDEEDFNNKLNYEFFVEEIEQLKTLYTRFDSITSLIVYYSKIQKGEKQEILKTDRPDEFFSFMKKITPAFIKYDEEVLVNKLNVKYSIKETREELGFKNKRTFKKWLNYFYGNKFDGKKYFTLVEYSDVFKKFFLKSDEEDFEVEKFSEEYLTRIQKGLRFKKADLIKYSENNYKIFKLDILDLESLLKLELPSDVDSFPFSIADLIKKNLE